LLLRAQADGAEDTCKAENGGGAERTACGSAHLHGFASLDGLGVGRGAQAEAKNQLRSPNHFACICERVGRGALQGQQDSAAAAR
jgi:hypothetical protein